MAFHIEHGIAMDKVFSFVVPLLPGIGGGANTSLSILSPRRPVQRLQVNVVRRRHVPCAYLRVGTAAVPGDNGLRQFLKELSQHSMLSEEEERALLLRVQASREHERVQMELKTEFGRDAEEEEVAERLGLSRVEYRKEKRGCLEARDELVKANLRLVVHIASLLYRGKGEETSGMGLADLIQEGCLALIRAAERFDVKKSEKFAPYAFRAVWSRCRRACVPVGCIVSIPERLKEAVRKTRRLDREEGRQERSSVIAEAEMHLMGGGVYLDAPLKQGDGELTVMDSLQSTKPRPEQVVERGDVWLACRKRLSERDARIIKLKFGLGGERPRLAKEIGKMEGLSAARVGQIVGQALDTLRVMEPGLVEYLHDL